MIALLRKDRDWLLISLAVGTSIAFLLLSAIGFESLFVFDSGWHLRPLAEVAWIPAAVLGILVALREDLARTREYLLHRPVSRARAFVTRALAGASVVVLWTILGIALLFLQEIVFGEGLACVQWGRATAAFASITAHTLACYGLVLFAMRFPGSWRMRIAVGVAGWFLVQAVHVALGASLVGWQPFGADHFIALLALFAVFLAMGAVCEREGKDLDRPLSARALIRIVPVLVLVVATAGTVAASSWSESWLGLLFEARPCVVELESGELSLAGPQERDGMRALLGPDHRPTGGRWTRGEPVAHVQPPLRIRIGVSWLEARFIGWDWGHWASMRVATGASRRVELTSSGSIRTIDIDHQEGTRRCSFLSHPEGRSFSTSARVFEARVFDARDEAIFVADGEQGEIWRVTEGNPPRLVESPLPEGDRYRAGDDVVLGERGAWVWKSNEWEPASTELLESRGWVLDPVTNAWVSLRSRGDELEVAFVTDDPLAPDAEIRAPGGSTLRHRFSPQTGREKFYAASVILGSLLRPAPAELYSALDPELPERAAVLAWLVDPVLNGRPWLLACNLLVQGALAGCTVLVLRRRGARGARALGWAVAVFLSGALGLLVSCWVETRRAWARPVASAVREPLIRSA